jgi:sec-independent protein translocase protein TatA
MTTSLPLAILDVGTPELLLIFFVILLLFGGQRLPELAKGLGKSVREFKKATAGVEEEIKRAMDEQPAQKPAQQVLPAVTAPVPTTVAATAVPAEHQATAPAATEAKA